MANETAENVEVVQTTESPDDPGFSDKLSAAVESQVESPAQESVEAPPEPAAPSLVEHLSALGFENLQDEREAQARAVEALRQAYEQQEQLQQELQRQQQLAQYGNHYLALAQSPEYRQYQEWRAQQAQVQQQPQSWWSPPSVDEKIAARYIQKNPETGESQWLPDTPLEVRQNFEKRQVYLEDWARDLLYDPPKAAQRIFEGEIRPQIERMLQEREQRQYAQQQQHYALQAAQSIQQQNLPWLYVTDQRTGQPMVDPRTGQYVPTQQGQMVMESLNLIDRAHQGDPNARWQAAALMALGRSVSQQAAPQPVPTAQDVNAQKKQQFQAQNGAGRIANRGASVNAARNPQGPSQNKFASFDEKLAAELQANGLL